MIAGTSTGGLIAVMLGVLEMDINICIEKYQELAKEVFPKPKAPDLLGIVKKIQIVLGVNRYDYAKLETVIKDIVKTQAKPLVPENVSDDRREILPMDFRTSPDGTEPKCKVMLCATAERLAAVTIFRSYHLQGAAEAGNIQCCIWEACRATSAAPFFLAPIRIGLSRYVDGALSCNNPAAKLLEEARTISGDREVGSLLSLGTGIRQLQDVFTGLKIVKTLKEKVLQTQDTHGALLKQFSGRKVYHRFDVNIGLDKVGLAEADKADLIERASHRYMDEQLDNVKECVEQLLRPASG